MQHLLTLAATATLFSTIGFILIGYPIYVWHRTRPIPAPVATAIPAATVEPPVTAPVLPVEPVFTADAIASPTVKRRRKVSPLVQEVIATQPKKRGRPPKAKAA